MTTILYRDDDLIAVVKPAGVSSQDTGSGDCLPAMLEADGFPVKPVHRLDQATGGVMIYARSDRAAAALSALVGQHDVFCKEYLAVVAGTPAEPAGTLEDLLYHDVHKNKSYVVNRPRKGVRQASLSYEVAATATKDGKPYSLLKIRLHTGRTHQIRVQFASRGLPLVGDARYGGERSSSLALWSCRLTFPHPFTHETVTAAQLPDTAAYPWNLFDLTSV